MNITRSKSNKALAMATGTLIVRYIAQPGDDGAGDRRIVEMAVDESPILRRVGRVTVKLSEQYLEVHVDVAYGPVYGCHESDLQRQLKAMVLSGLLPAGRAIEEYAVFNFSRVELNETDLQSALEKLVAQAEDINLPLSVRKNVEKTITRLKQHVATPSARA